MSEEMVALLLRLAEEAPEATFDSFESMMEWLDT